MGTDAQLCYERAVATFQAQKHLRATMPVRTATDRQALTVALKATAAQWWQDVAPVFAKGYAHFREEQQHVSQANYARLTKRKALHHVTHAVTTADAES